MRITLALLLVALLAAAAVLWSTRETPEPVADAIDEPREPAAPAPAATAPADADPVAAATAPEPAEGDRITRLNFERGAGFDDLLDELGLSDLDAKQAEWGLARGYVQMDDVGNPLLDQPYGQLDDETLRSFAENGDMWAQQFLGERLASTRPAEAIEWFRKAAMNGSLHAMTEIARLYQAVGSMRGELQSEADSGGLDQLYALKDDVNAPITAYAWAAVAERAGWDPLYGSMKTSHIGSQLNDDEKKEACGVATGIFDSLTEERRSAGLGEYDRRPPPVVFDVEELQTGTACLEGRSTFDLSGCREVHVSAGEVTNKIWVCDEE